jgi:hypothetical protein
MLDCILSIEGVIDMQSRTSGVTKEMLYAFVLEARHHDLSASQFHNFFLFHYAPETPFLSKFQEIYRKR